MNSNVYQVVLTADPSRLQQGFQVAQKAVETFGQVVDRVRGLVERSFDRIDKLVKDLAGRGALIGGFVSAGLALGTKNASDFQTEMAGVNAITGYTNKQLGDLANTVEELSTRIPQSTEALSQAATVIAQAGFRGAEANNLLEISGKAATAGLTAPASAASTLTSIIRAYHQGAAQAQQDSDILFKTVRVGALSFDQLASSTQDWLQIAATAGVSLNQVSAALATMSQTVGPQDASTNVERIISSFISSTPQMDAIVKQLSGNSRETAASFLQENGLYGAINKITGAVHGNVSAYQELFPRLGTLEGILALTANNGQNYAKVFSQLSSSQNTAGATAAAYGTQVNTAANQSKILHQTVEALGSSFTRVLLTPIRLGEQNLSAFVGVVNKAPTPLKSLGAGIGVVVSAFGTLGALLLVSKIRLAAIALAIEHVAKIPRFANVGILQTAKEFTESPIGFISSKFTEDSTKITGLAAKGFEGLWSGVKKGGDFALGGINSLILGWSRPTAQFGEKMDSVWDKAKRGGNTVFDTIASKIRGLGSETDKWDSRLSKVWTGVKFGLATLGIALTAFSLISNALSDTQQKASDVVSNIGKGDDRSTPQGQIKYLRDARAEYEKYQRQIRSEGFVPGGPLAQPAHAGLTSLAGGAQVVTHGILSLFGAGSAVQPSILQSAQNAKATQDNYNKAQDAALHYFRAITTVEQATGANESQVVNLAQAYSIDLSTATKDSTNSLIANYRAQQVGQQIAQGLSLQLDQLRGRYDLLDASALNLTQRQQDLQSTLGSFTAATAQTSNTGPPGSPFNVAQASNSLNQANTQLSQSNYQVAQSQYDLDQITQNTAKHVYDLAEAEANLQAAQLNIPKTAYDVEKAEAHLALVRAAGRSTGEVTEAEFAVAQARADHAKAGADLYDSQINLNTANRTGFQYNQTLTQAENALASAKQSVASATLSQLTAQQAYNSQLAGIDPTQVSLPNLRKNLTHATGQVEQYSQDLVTISKRTATGIVDPVKAQQTSQEVIGYLTSLGAQGYQAVHQLATAAPQDFESMKNLIIQNAKETGAGAAVQLSAGLDIAAVAASVGANKISSAITSVLGLIPAQVQAIATQFPGALSGFNFSVAITSQGPSSPPPGKNATPPGSDLPPSVTAGKGLPKPSTPHAPGAIQLPSGQWVVPTASISPSGTPSMTPRHRQTGGHILSPEFAMLHPRESVVPWNNPNLLASTAALMGFQVMHGASAGGASTTVKIVQVPVPERVVREYHLGPIQTADNLDKITKEADRMARKKAVSQTGGGKSW